jgi:hypothetical protein
MQGLHAGRRAGNGATRAVVLESPAPLSARTQRPITGLKVVITHGGHGLPKPITQSLRRDVPLAAADF